jgi:L-cystine transport system substrate-binding protein
MRAPKFSLLVPLLVVAIFCLAALTSCASRRAGNQATTVETALGRVKREKVLRVGYGGFPPYTIIDSKETDPNKRVKGFAADLVQEIANRSVPKLTVEWHIISWDSLATDMRSQKFDFIADPVYATVPRALEFSYTVPYSYFGIALGLVRKDENRFHNFSDLDRSDITVAMAEGWVSTDYARDHLQKPHFKTIPVGGDSFVQLDDVLTGRADIALQDSPSVVQYAKAHPDKVKILWLQHPPSVVPGGFMVRREDTDLKDFLDICMRLMKADGTIAKLDQKWKTYGYFEHSDLVPAAGLQQYLDTGK